MHVRMALAAVLAAAVRYAASDANFGPFVGPHNGLGAQSAPEKHWGNQPRALPGFEGQGHWLIPIEADGQPITSTASAGRPSSERVTFSKDLAPVLFEHCAPC